MLSWMVQLNSFVLSVVVVVAGTTVLLVTLDIVTHRSKKVKVYEEIHQINIFLQ